MNRRDFLKASALTMAEITLPVTAFGAAAEGAVGPGPGRPLYLGVSYYPEVNADRLEADIALMKEIGINHVRFGEFAWSRMEPTEGVYDFSIQSRALKKFSDAGIAVTLCTPTAAPPVWLLQKHPDVVRTTALGLTIEHGGRRPYCPNSKTYLAYAEKIAEAMGKQFGGEAGIISWQIDNELWEECFCSKCENAFHGWLERRFGTVAQLNRQWLTVLWSQEYQAFDQVPLPNPNRVGAGHHPSLLRAYRHFMSDSYVAFANRQAVVLRRHTRAPITTNAHGPLAQRIDYRELFRSLDWVETDSYADVKNLARYAFECDWMRPFGKPFWMAETDVTYGAATSAPTDGQFLHEAGALRAKMWLTYALGAQAVSFWLWRTHWAGQEMEHGALLYTWGEEAPGTKEIRQVGQELKTAQDWLRTTRPRPAAVAMHYGVPSQWIFETTPIAAGFSYDAAVTAFHRELLNAGIARDVIHVDAPLEAYRTVFSPYLPVIDAALFDRIEHFVEQGGTWILGPLSACRTVEATAYDDAAYGGALEKWLGIHVRNRGPVGPTQLSTDVGIVACREWCDAYAADAAQRVRARYHLGAFDGQAAIVEKAMGKGRVILLGTLPESGWLQTFLREVAPAGHTADPGVVWTERVDGEGKPGGWIAVNTRSTPAQLAVGNEAAMTLAAYEVKMKTAG